MTQIKHTKNLEESEQIIISSLGILLHDFLKDNDDLHPSSLSNALIKYASLL